MASCDFPQEKKTASPLFKFADFFNSSSFSGAKNLAIGPLASPFSSVSN
jgi:hypothetical protein